jgi:protocatechuate 3,4-dioxygenase beta subunit
MQPYYWFPSLRRGGKPVMQRVSHASFSRTMLVAVLALACAQLLPAQKNKDKDDPTVRTLQGQVNDPDDKPVSGAVVQLKDTRTLQVRSFITQENGEYRFSGLRADTDYEVKADYNGMSSDNKRLSNFDSRKSATVNLKLNKK